MAQQSEPVKPYILFIADTSGSMGSGQFGGPTGFGSPSCAAVEDNRLNHLKCALSNIINGYGDMVMGLGRFRQETNRTVCTVDGFCNWDGVNCDGCTTGGSCFPEQSSADRFELLVPILEQNQGDLLDWVNFNCGTCDLTTGGDSELEADGFTPIGGSLKGAKRYFQGLDTPGVDTNVGEIPYWVGPGDDPVRDDPLRNVFIGGQQCRPYIVIMLTDGSETCTPNFTETVDAASALLSTEIDTLSYRIETKPIGFGRTPGDSQIEQLAHAGGAPDVPGQNEGFYAQNEQELSLAISQIISEAIKFEICNDIDDDCDLAIDEGFEDKGTTCDDGFFGICRGTGFFQCTADGSGLECVIDTPGQPPGAEICNDLDDDCDNLVDEGNVCAGCNPIELCNAMDDDCDGLVDEGITRPCGTDVGECTSGIETCNNGVFEGCTATGGSPETCDGIDNDCDGTIDGFAQSCVTIPGNNPGQGNCQAGTSICPSDGSGMFGPCLGEVGPFTEVCNNFDDDCDVAVDEETGGDACVVPCGAGLTECVDGALECRTVSMSEPETCNGNDDDCDGLTDEGIPDRGDCDPDGLLCQPGVERCVAGEFQCVGGVERQPEACDCLDNDCDDTVDEGSDLCGAGETCVQCQCARTCASGEFPCDPGFQCVNDFCVVDLCFEVDCQPDEDGFQTECVEGECVRSCDRVTCPGNLVCQPATGSCVVDDCTSFPDRCSENELCIEGQCISDPCMDVTCEGEQYCFDGDCVGSCGPVECSDGQRCVLGACENDPCRGPCGEGRICDDELGQCRSDPCNLTSCPDGLACNPENGQCESDPCADIQCPGSTEVCVQGTCYRPEQLIPEDKRPKIENVTAAGGGCSAGGGSGAPMGVALLGFALVLCRQRRWRRRRRAAPRGQDGSGAGEPSHG